MKLISLLEKLEYTCLQGSTDQEVKNVIYDSRKVEEGSLFICIRGAVVDGHKFVPDVVFRISRRETENNRYHRNKRKNNHYVYGKIYSGKCRI